MMFQGYAVIEYGQFEEAQAAVARMDGVEILGKAIHVGFAFSTGPMQQSRRSSRR